MKKTHCSEIIKRDIAISWFQKFELSSKVKELVLCQSFRKCLQMVKNVISEQKLKTSSTQIMQRGPTFKAARFKGVARMYDFTNL